MLRHSMQVTLFQVPSQDSADLANLGNQGMGEEANSWNFFLTVVVRFAVHCGEDFLISRK